VWRIKKYYITDAPDDTGKKFWEHMAADKEAHIRVLEEEIREKLV
tara:strand:+ start:3016 stop:3150 length:135 start_codon:yes stop_codon:yes gene_type:complete